MPLLVRRGVNVPTAAETLGLNEVTKFISEKNPNVRLTIHIQTFDHPFVYYLLIIVDDGTQLSNEDAAVRIEQECAHLVSVVAFVKKTKWLDAVLQGKLKDFCYAVLPGNVRYRSPLFEKSNEIRSPLRISAADIKASWDKWGDEGHGLFFEALNLQDQGRYPECLLRVNKSIAYSLKALIGMYTGHIPKTIDITRLLKMSLLCTAGIWRIFYKNSDSSRQALKVLFSINDDNDQSTDIELNEPALNVLMLNAHLLTVCVEHEYLGLLENEKIR
ncbi:hypothetical protein ABID99_000719 [Mucilaginibacter sp. OAE612]